MSKISAMRCEIDFLYALIRDLQRDALPTNCTRCNGVGAEPPGCPESGPCERCGGWTAHKRLVAGEASALRSQLAEVREDFEGMCDKAARTERDAGEACSRMRGQKAALRSELAEVTRERDEAIAQRDAWKRQCDLASEARASALSGESEAVRRAESAELGCEIAYRREPTQAEGDAHEHEHHESMGPARASGECFVPMGGWTGRRCRVCNRWTWGGPTACEACAAFEAGREREDAIVRDVADAKAALGPAWMHGGASLADGIRRKTTAMERLSMPPKRKRPGATLMVEREDGTEETTKYGGDR